MLTVLFDNKEVACIGECKEQSCNSQEMGCLILHIFSVYNLHFFCDLAVVFKIGLHYIKLNVAFVFVAFVPWSLTFIYGHFHVKEKLIYFMLLIIKEKKKNLVY